MKGARPAHAAIRRSTGELVQDNPLVVDGEVLSSVAEAVMSRAMAWTDEWTRRPQAAQSGSDALKALILQVRSQERDTVEFDTFELGLRRIAATRGLGSDLVEASFAQQAPDSVKRSLHDIVAQAQTHVSWPAQARLTKMSSIGKPSGGDRAIGVTAFIYALYGECVRSNLDLWRDDCCGFWDTAVRGSSSLRAALLRVVLAEVHTASGAEVAFALSDFRKFYDSLDWATTLKAAADRGFPLETLAMAFLAYTGPRLFVVNDAVSLPVHPMGNSILAGCFSGGDMARSVLYALLEFQRRAY